MNYFTNMFAFDNIHYIFPLFLLSIFLIQQKKNISRKKTVPIKKPKLTHRQVTEKKHQ